MTLVELIIAIGILVLILSITLPKIDLDKYEINSFARQLCSDIRYVRKKNMLGELSTYIYFTTDDKSMSYNLRGNGINEKKIYLPKGSNIEQTNSRIIFKRDGTPDPTGGTIHIQGKNLSREITIVPVSGRVLLKEGKYEEKYE